MFTSNISGYFEGIVGNLQLMPIYYPGWVIRLYHDIRSDDPVMKVYFAFEYSYQNTNVSITLHAGVCEFFDFLLQDLCNLACTDTNIDLCNVRQLPGKPMPNAIKIFPMNWRWFPTMDPQVSMDTK